LEIFEQIAAPDILLAPVGGGGLISGSSIVSKALSPATRVIAAEPAQADDAYQSFKTGERVVIDSPDTIADGLRASIGPINFELIRENVDDIVRVEEVDIIAAMRFVWERMKIIIEPSSAVPVAALIEGIVDIKGKTVAVILTGGNVDLDCLPWSER
jgi:threonine dehydratase